MKREEAQFVLRAYRANGEDARDPQFAEALALVRQDPDLARWFAAEQTFDAIIAAKIHASLPVPPRLKDQLLLARATIRRVPWWRRPVWLVAAGCLLLLLSVAGPLLRRSRGGADFESFRAAMMSASADAVRHADAVGLSADGFARWIAEHGGESDFVLPPALAEKGISACKVIDWQAERVTLLCFMFSGRHVDVFVVDESALPGVLLGAAPQFLVEAGRTTAAWRHGGKIYLAASNLPPADLQQLL